jgi:aminoglycoside phosphotransferase (APT) family kinase protein
MAEDLPGLPAEPTEKWLRAELPSLLQDGPWRAEVISGGLSNITYRLFLPSGPVILRRPPLGHTLPRAHDMAREHRVISALGPTPVPVPSTLALCEDHSVLGVTFYVMQDVPGSVLRTTADTEPLSQAQRGQLASVLISTLADLHEVDVDAVGLSDYGKRSGYCARQIRTWGGQWERAKTRDLPDMDRLLTLLSERAPAQDSGLAVVHGDFRIDNTVTAFGDDGTPRIAAVLDWELSTLGDPLADLATTLSYWHDPGDEERAKIPVSGGLTDKAGFPTGAALAERYASRTGRDLSNLPFYTALAGMKLAAICEGVHARYLGGQTVGAGYERAGAAVPLLVSRALGALRELKAPANPGGCDEAFGVGQQSQTDRQWLR